MYNWVFTPLVPLVEQTNLVFADSNWVCHTSIELHIFYKYNSNHPDWVFIISFQFLLPHHLGNQLSLLKTNEWLICWPVKHVPMLRSFQYCTICSPMTLMRCLYSLASAKSCLLCVGSNTKYGTFTIPTTPLQNLEIQEIQL